MRTTKKLFAALLACLMLALPTVAILPVSAAGDLTDGLVVAYDFEGETETDQLADKAPNGTTADNLKSAENSTVANGLLKSTNATSNKAETEKKAFADLTNITEYTVYTKVKLGNVGTKTSGTVEFLTIGGFFTLRISTVNTSTHQYALGIRSSTNGWKDSTALSGNAGELANGFFTNEEYMYMAFALKLDNGTLTMNSYYSVDGVNYTNIKNEFTNITATSWTAGNTTAGLRMGWNLQNFCEVYYDDLFIFNRALDATEVVQLSSLKVSQDRVGYIASQETAVAGGKFDVRFLATIDELTYDEVGFKINVKATGVDKTVEQKCSTVYDSIIGMDETYTSKQLGGKYILALGIRGMNVYEGNTTFTVTPYYVKDSVKTECTSYTVIYNNGEFVSATAAQ